MADLASVLADLTAEGDVIQALVAPLPPEQWAMPTPAAGWTIADQIGHLAWTDRVAELAVTRPASFEDVLAQVAADPDGYVDRAAHEVAACPPHDLLATWNDGRRRLVAALAAVPAGTKVAWFGPAMSPTSMATARLMETWAHGLDVAETLGAPMSVSDRLRHVAHLGVRTRDFAFRLRGRTPPTAEFRIELTGPSGQLWAWGPDDAEQQVAGPALDFCLLVTQRRHRADLRLLARGRDADEWLDIAQAFAGRPGQGRAPVAARQAVS